MDAYWNAYHNAFRAGEQRNNALFQGLDQGAQRTAAQALASNDYAGAQKAYASRGMADQVLAVQDRQRQSEEQARKLTGDRYQLLGQAVSALRNVPAEQRAALLQTRIAPMLTAQGLPQDMLAQIGPEDLADQALDAFAAALGQAEETRVFQDGRFVRGIGAQTGRERFAYDLPEDPLEREYQEARIAATRAQVGRREAAAEKARRGPAPRGGGGGGHGGSKSGGKPWEREWN